jgi:Transposase DDE domain group 1
MTAQVLLSWLKLLALDGDLARAEPKTLRYRVLNAAARLVRGGRRRRWKIAANWPWADAITRAWQRITALSDPGLPARTCHCDLWRTIRGLWNPAATARQPGNRDARTAKSRPYTRPSRGRGYLSALTACSVGINLHHDRQTVISCRAIWRWFPLVDPDRGMGGFQGSVHGGEQMGVDGIGAGCVL